MNQLAGRSPGRAQRRGVAEDVLNDWYNAERDLKSFLDDVGADESAHTVSIRLLTVDKRSPQDFANWLNEQVWNDGTWAFLTTTPDSSGQIKGMALPVVEPAGVDRKTVPFLFPFVEIHTVLLSWWLVYAWRTRQLSDACAELADRDQVVAAAACARPLMETAATVWSDSRKIADAWADLKRDGSPLSETDSLQKRGRMIEVLNEALFGAKFDDKVPDEKKLWGRITRTNVLSDIDKLARELGHDFQREYQWLCNVVHPSLGNMLGFSTPPLVHHTKTHFLTWFSGSPAHIQSSDGSIQTERTVQTMTARGVIAATRALTIILDAALKVVDDVGLTTKAPSICREKYWRNFGAVSRNELCPCRSGLKSKRCPHEWAGDAPKIPPLRETEGRA